MKKVIITIICLALLICGIVGFKILVNKSKNKSSSELIETQIQDSTDENLVNEEIVIPLENTDEKDSTDDENSLYESNDSQNDKLETSEKAEAKATASKSTTSNSASSKKSNTSSNQGSNTQAPTTASTPTSKSSANDNSKTKTDTSSSSNNKTSSSTSTETKKTPVYCYEGGKKHLGGDGSYEHGYYNTWQQAWDALTVYMKDMNSGNYYIDQCLGCNKYYYYCKPD